MRPEDFFEIIDGIDDDIILDIPELGSEKPTEVVIESKGTPFWAVALSAACLLCVLMTGVFVVAKLRNDPPIEPGPYNSTTTENSSYESDSNSNNSDISETSESTSNSGNSDNSETSEQNSKPEPQPVDIGNGMTLTGTLLDESELEEFSIEPYISNSYWYWGEAEEEFLDSLEIPELKDVYKRAQSLFARLSTVSLNPTFAAVENERKPAHITVTEDGEYVGEYMEWGYTYESFYNSYLSAYTKETTEEIFKEYNFFLNYNGALLCKDTAIGGNMDEVHREYELISKGDTVIECRRIVFNHDRDFKPAMEYIPELRDEYVITYTEFGFILTEDGWRVRLDNLNEGLIY